MQSAARTILWLPSILSLLACGGGVPITLYLDEHTLDLDLEEAVDEMGGELGGVGVLPPGIDSLPELWPQSLPPVRYSMVFSTPPSPIDLNPEEGAASFAKYEQINRAKEALRRIEINRLVLRIEESNLTVALPELRFQVADDPNAHPDDRKAWFTIGTLPGAEAGAIGDLHYVWAPGGESFLNSQLGDEAKKFAVRAIGRFAINTEDDRRLPGGKAVLRLIVAVTFFVAPERAI